MKNLFPAIISTVIAIGTVMFFQETYFYIHRDISIYLSPIKSSTKTGLSYLDEHYNVKTLEDGNYVLGCKKEAIFLPDDFITIIKKDSNSSYRQYMLNLMNKASRIEMNNNYFKLSPFHSDYIKNDLLTSEKFDSTIINAEKDYYFLHVENGYGVIFKKSLDIEHTSDHNKTLLKVYSAAQNAGYITK